MDPAAIWNVLRSYLTVKTFYEIKDVVGTCGIDVTELAHLEQKQRGGASRRQLITAIDGEFKKLSDYKKKGFVIYLSEKLLPSIRNETCFEGKPKFEQLHEDLRHFGYTIVDNAIVPLDFFNEEDLNELPNEARQDLIIAAQSYRDGDLSGSLGNVCGAIDSVTRNILSSDGSQKQYKEMSFQEKCKKAYEAKGFFDKLEADLTSIKWTAEDIKPFINNYKGSVKQVAFVLQKLRSDMGNAHGTEPTLRALVFDSIKWAQIILRDLAD